MIYAIGWLLILVLVVAPAFPRYGLLFWVATYFLPFLVVIPIVEAVAR